VPPGGEQVRALAHRRDEVGRDVGNTAEPRQFAVTAFTQVMPVTAYVVVSPSEAFV